jgi:hypothetical protein
VIQWVVSKVQGNDEGKTAADQNEIHGSGLP